MTVVDPNCGNTIGMVFWTDDANVPIGVYCSRDSGIIIVFLPPANEGIVFTRVWKGRESL